MSQELPSSLLKGRSIFFVHLKDHNYYSSQNDDDILEKCMRLEKECLKSEESSSIIREEP